MSRRPNEVRVCAASGSIRMDSEQARAGTVDLRLIQPLERLPLFELTLTALGSEEDLRVIVGHDPQRLLSYLRERYKESLALEVVTDGPSVWVLRVRRTRYAGAPP